MNQTRERRTSPRAAGERRSCRFPTCPGHYRREHIVHHEPFRNHTVFIDDVPADVCTICGDTLLPASTVQKLEQWRDRLEQGSAGPADQTELYHFGRRHAPAEAA